MDLTVSVAPEVAQEVRGQGRLVVSLTSLDRPDSPPIILPYAPESYDTQAAPRWTARAAVRVVNDRSDWQGNAPTSWAVQHTFQDRARAESTEAMIARLESWALVPTLATGQPTLVLLSWGVRAIIGHIEDLTIKRLHCDALGQATKAEVAFKIVANVQDL